MKLRDQWGYSETYKTGWIRFWASISEETETGYKISSRNSTLGETKLIFLVYEYDSKKKKKKKRKKDQSVGKMKIILFDS